MIHGLSLAGWLSGRGLWQYLSTRAVARAEVDKARIALEQDRERSEAVVNYIAKLPDGAELADYEDGGGRKIWIRKAGCGHCAGQAAAQLTVVPEEVAAFTEIGSAEHPPAGEISS